MPATGCRQWIYSGPHIYGRHPAFPITSLAHPDRPAATCATYCDDGDGASPLNNCRAKCSNIQIGDLENSQSHEQEEYSLSYDRCVRMEPKGLTGDLWEADGVDVYCEYEYAGPLQTRYYGKYCTYNVDVARCDRTIAWYVHIICASLVGAFCFGCVFAYTPCCVNCHEQMCCYDNYNPEDKRKAIRNKKAFCHRCWLGKYGIWGWICCFLPCCRDKKVPAASEAPASAPVEDKAKDPGEGKEAKKGP